MLSTHHHLWLPSKRATRTLIMLHGTGGNENSLLPLAQRLDPTANFLAPRGNVLEHGMPRFFRRLAEGVFDMEDLRTRTLALADWLNAACEVYGFDPKTVTIVGYSNGANVAAAMLLMRPELISQGLLANLALLRPMLPLRPEVDPDLSGARVLVSAGRADRITPYLGDSGAKALSDYLASRHATVTNAIDEGDHALHHHSLAATMNWLNS
jgi:phospholipase/carboxylesterase